MPPNKILIIFISTLFIITISATCYAERCCNINPCTQTYCTSKTSQTWISTQNFANYGYTKLVLSNSSCLPCSYNCQSCSTETTCTTCSSGFYMSNGNCLLCSYMCSSCLVVNNIAKCSACSGSTYLDSITVSCKNCPTGALTCSSSTVISQCQTGYYLTQNSMFCLSCPANCNNCPFSNTVCSACSTGFYLNSSLCYACSLDNCISCSFSAGKQICLSCSAGFYVSSGTCKACPNYCSKCSSTSCITCSQGYYLVGGACSASSLTIDNCNTYSSPTTCSTCLSNFYLNNTLCYSCSLLCTNCYNIHAGACTACATNSVLFNQMCLPSNYLSNSQYQLYYSFPSSSKYLTSGSQDCNHYLYSGTTITLSLSNLAASAVSITWKIFSVGGSTTYTTSWTNSDTTLNNTYTTSSSQYQAYPLCFNNASSLYSLSQTSQTISTVKVSNSLSFSTNNGAILALQQVLVIVTSCNSLCVQCSSVACTQCQMSNLYTQDAYCVYSCSSGYYIYYNSTNTNQKNTCVQLCPLGTYTLVSNLTCALCQPPCLSCLTEAFCLSCIENYFLTQTNTCLQSCPYQHFGQSTTKTCQKCSGRCNDCLDTIRCLTCLTGFFYASNHTCLDDCYTGGITGMYANLTTLTCQLCSSNCLNCLTSSTYCTSCKSTTFFYNHTCLAACPFGYYSDNTSACRACQYPCQTCSIIASNCTACTDRYLLQNTCVSDCPNGYFQGNSALSCVSCNFSCSQCAQSANNCLKCKPNFFLFNNTCLSTCPTQFFPNINSNLCQICVGYCYTCTSTDNCTACNTNFLLNGSCVTASSCPDTHYADITQLACLPCTAPCLTCEYIPTHCTNCDPNSTLPLLQNNTCLASCASTSTYPGTLGTGKACFPCLSPCLTCINITYCLSCVPGYMLTGGSCSTSCSPAYYFNATSTSCQACSNGCLACLSLLFCQVCQSSYFTLQINDTSNKCVDNCGTLMYASSVGSTCKSCLYPCANCTSAVDCLTCQTGALYQNRCLSTCPDTTYLDTTTSSCAACLPNCLTCSKAPTHCITCLSSYYLSTLNNTCQLSCPAATYPQNVTQMCLQCPSSCSTCLNSTYCTTCIVNRTYLYSQTHVCLSACPLSSFPNTTTNTCDRCSTKCLTCTLSASNCLSCNSNYYLIQLSVTTFDCVTNCPSGYYQQSQNCQACVFPCNTCNTPTACLTCVTGTYFYANTSSCLLACPSITFLNSDAQTCQLCTSPCTSCRTSTYCLSCTASLFLLNGQCLANCPPQYYSDSTEICNQCSGLCKTCTSKFYCLSCLTGYLSNGYCYSSCPPGTFANLNISACQPCLPPCLECTFSTSYCTHCTGSLVVFQGACRSSCPNGTYLSSGICLSCQFPCINCVSSLTCSQCLGGYLLYNSLACIKYSLFCPNGLYKMDSKYCIPRIQCPSNYNTDPDLRTCSSSCSPSKYTQPNNKSCVYSCETFQYAGVGMVCQNYSANPPISLMGMNAITFIQSNIMNIIVSFNQTVIWLNSTNPYTLTTTSVSRLLLTNQLNYSLISGDPTNLILRVTSIPTSAQLTLPANNLVSATTNYPLQTPNITITLPPFVTYDYSTIYQGQLTSQFGYGLGWFIILLSIIYLFQNRISHLYTLWDTVQLLYVVILLDIQYPPALNQFLRGLNTTLFLSFPNMFSQGTARTFSASPFYAYTYDNNFLRNAGPSLTLGIIVIIIYCIFKGLAQLAKRVQRVRNCMDEYPKFKRFLYQTLLRFRWHYVSDVFFLTYISVFLFGVAQILNVNLNPGRFVSNALCAITLIIYIIFPIFAGVKLHRHFPDISKGKHSENLRCFYRGIDKTSQFGVFLIMIRYFRKLIYAIVIGVFSLKPMFALPILMFTSVLMALFIFLKLPFKKRLSNIVQIINEFCIAILFLCMAIINFNNKQNFTGFNIVLGYVCTGLLIFILLMLVFQVFCRSLFHLKSQQEIRKEKEKKLQDLSEQQMRKRAGQFFDYMFPRIRKEFGFGEQSDQQQSYKYEEGDSQNSENNMRREQQWGIHDQQAQSDEFRHYGSESEQPTQAKLKAPQYLIRCVKQIK